MHRRVLQRYLVGYVLIKFATLPLALLCWNRFLRDSLGRLMTVNQIHMAEYMGVGVLAAWYAHAGVRPRRTLMKVGTFLLVVGFVDEVIQAALPQRFFQWSDVALNWSGAMVGLGLTCLLAWMVNLRRPTSHV